MLVLTRNAGEWIQIGDQIRVQITDIQGNRVRIGISAPTDVAIRREEICFEANCPKKTESQPS